jgi:oligopeptide/dipeptide ABC transporter ATP-binding protein
VSSETVLEARDLTVEYPTSRGLWRPVVDDLSLTVAAGERVGLVGSSGSGKSVAALACLGLVTAPGRIRRGVVSASGVSLPARESDRWSSIRGREIGIVFQEPSSALNPVFSVGFQLAELLVRHRGMTRRHATDEAQRLLDDVGLDDLPRVLRSYPHQLSGGQLQRVTIALALAGRPRLLIADECTTGLDVILQAEVLSLIRGLTEEQQLGLLLISHDLAVIAGMVERVIVLFAGQIVEQAPTDALFSAPLHPFTRELLASATVAGSSTASPSPADVHRRETQVGCRFAARCPLAIQRCREVAPELVEIGDGRALRCPVIGGDSASRSGGATEVRDG